MAAPGGEYRETLGRPGDSATVYVAGTTTLATLYTDVNETTAAPNPTVLDSFGALLFFADVGAYDVRVNGALIRAEVTAHVGTFVAAIDDGQRTLLESLASADVNRALSLARVRYDDGTEIVNNDHSGDSGLTGWDATKFAVAASKLQSAWDSGEGTVALSQAFAVASGASARYVFQLTVAATAAATNTALFTGLFIQAAAFAASYGTMLGVGVNELNQPIIYSSIGITSSAAVVDATPIAAGDYIATVTIEDTFVCFALVNALHTLEYKTRVARSVLTGSAAGFLLQVNRDSRKSTGNTIGPVFAKTNAATSRSRLATAERQADTVVWTLVGSNNVRIHLPAIYDSRQPTPVIIWCHGSGRSADVVGNSNTESMVRAMSATYGYMVVATEYTAVPNDWGIQAILDSIYAAYQYARDHYAIGPIIMAGASMGGLASLLTIAERRVPGIVGWYGTYPVVNLQDVYNGASGSQFTSAIETAYGFSGAGNFAAATAGHDPMLKQPWAFRGVRMRASASYSDTAVFQASQTDLFLAKMAGYSAEASLLQGTGPHGDPSQTSASDFDSFIRRCLLK